jgi:hypothetical protein
MARDRSPDFHNVVSSLPHLSADELHELGQRIKALSSFQTTDLPQSITTDAKGDLILDAIASFMQGRGLEFTSASTLVRSPQYRAFAQKIPAVMKYLEQVTTVQIEQRAIAAIAVELLYENLVEMGVAVTSRTVMSHVHRIPSILNRAFPGYAQCGMLHMIVRGRKVHSRD